MALTELFRGLSVHVSGIPKWMRKMNPDKMTAADRQHIMTLNKGKEAAAKKACLETEKNGARCIF